MQNTSRANMNMKEREWSKRSKKERKGKIFWLLWTHHFYTD